MKKILIIAALAATPALADEDWDSDGDGRMTKAEFDTGLSASTRFSDFDVNADGMVDEMEFGNGMFANYDRDGSGDIDEDERKRLDEDMGDRDED